jgi:4,5-dihydroxyphthalate decarboxylase
MVKQYPWITGNIIDVFEKAKRICLNALESDTTLVNSPWIASLLEEQYGSLKKRDLFPYGLETNRKELSTYLRYFWQQGLTAKLIAVDDLFAPVP